MTTEVLTLNEARGVTLTAYLQGVRGEFGNIARRPGMLVLPGGGYLMCSDREADPVALAYAGAGYQAFILRYSVGEHAEWPNPLRDYEAAMSLIREKAEEWAVDPERIAVVGFSAGGHLAAAAATLAENRPAAAVLGYPVTEEETARACLPSAPDLVSAVDRDTCPCFLFATRTDDVVPITNTLRFTLALAEAGVGFESHVYSHGPHGFSVADSSVLMPGTVISPRAARWVPDSIGWLREVLGDFGDGAMTEPTVPRRVNEDAAAFLSVDCTMARLMANEAARAVLQPMITAMREKMAEQYGDQMAAMPGETPGAGLGAQMTLRSILSFGGVPAETVKQLDAALRQIPND